MEKEKVVFFLDYANINRAAREKRYHLDYHDLLCYVGEARFLVDAHCYVPINPRNEHRLDREIEELWRSGYIVNTKLGTIAGGTYTCNFDVEIAMDVLRIAYQVKPDIIVLATGDSDFVSLIQEVRKSGVRVEVAAFYVGSRRRVQVQFTQQLRARTPPPPLTGTLTVRCPNCSLLPLYLPDEVRLLQSKKER